MSITPNHHNNHRRTQPLLRGGSKLKKLLEIYCPVYEVSKVSGVLPVALS